MPLALFASTICIVRVSFHPFSDHKQNFLAAFVRLLPFIHSLCKYMMVFFFSLSVEAMTYTKFNNSKNDFYCANRLPVATSSLSAYRTPIRFVFLFFFLFFSRRERESFRLTPHTINILRVFCEQDYTQYDDGTHLPPLMVIIIMCIHSELSIGAHFSSSLIC